MTRPLLAVFTKNRTNPAYAAARLGADRTAQRMGAVTQHYVPQKPDDINEQIALMREALTSKPDAFVFTPVHATAVNGAVHEINLARVPIFNIINRITAGDAVTFVGSDDYRLAFEIANHLCRHLDGRGGVVLIEGTPGSVTSQDRLRGFRDAIKSYQQIQILVERVGDYQRVTAQRVMEQLLESLPQIDGILSANDDMAMGIIDALTTRQMRIPLVGINAVPDAIAALKQNTLLATVDFDAMKMACIATEAAIRHLRGECVPREFMLPVQIVNRSNCEPWDRAIEERECPQWEDIAGVY
jgi:ribose transport system substrate-binding protein